MFVQLRYIVVIHPLKARYVDCPHMVRIIIGVWILSMALMTPYLFCARAFIAPSSPPAPTASNNITNLLTNKTITGNSSSSCVCRDACAGTTGNRIFKGIQNIKVELWAILCLPIVVIDAFSSSSCRSSPHHFSTTRYAQRCGWETGRCKRVARSRTGQKQRSNSLRRWRSKIAL